MTTLVAIFLPADATTRVVRAAFDEADFGEVGNLVEYLRPSKERKMIVGVYPWEHGEVVRTTARLDDALLGALARRVHAEGGTLVAIESEVEASWVTEWENGVPRRQEVRNPDWAAKERNREEPGDRIAAWQLEEVAERRLGARRRGSITLYFRARPVALVEVVRRAIAAGTPVTEVQHAGRAGFRVTTTDGARTVFLTPDETTEIRARLAK